MKGGGKMAWSTTTVAKVADDANMKRANVALRRFRTLGFDDIKPNDEEHLRAWLSLHATQTRVDAQMVLTFLATKVDTVDYGARTLQRFWGVPRSNFPHGLPDDLVDYHVVDPARLQNLAVDHSVMYVMDKSCELGRLGLGVYEPEKYVTANTRHRTSGGEPCTPALPALPASSGGELVPVGGPAHGGDLQPATVHSTGASSSDGAKRPAPGGDCGRLLKRHTSDVLAATAAEWTSPTRSVSVRVRQQTLQMEVLNDLKKSIDDCVAKDLWDHVDGVARPTSVRSAAEQLLDAIAEMLVAAGTEATEAIKVHTLAKYIVTFMLKTLLTHACYPHVYGFRGFFTRALTLTGDLINDEKKSEIALLEQLINIHPDSNTDMVDFGTASVFVKRPFATCTMFTGFLQYRCTRLLAAARDDTGSQPGRNQRRLATLETIQAMSADVDVSTSSTANLALQLFDDSQSLTSRAAYMCSTGQQHAAKLAADWDKDGPVGCVGMLFLDTTPVFSDMYFAAFAKACTAIVDAALWASLVSPVSLQSVTLVLSCKDAGHPQAVDLYIMSALHHRIGLKLPNDHALPGPESLVVDGVDHQLSVFKNLKIFLGGKHAKPPSWYTAWCTDVEATAKAKAEETKKARGRYKCGSTSGRCTGGPTICRTKWKNAFRNR